MKPGFITLHYTGNWKTNQAMALRSESAPKMSRATLSDNKVKTVNGEYNANLL